MLNIRNLSQKKKRTILSVIDFINRKDYSEDKLKEYLYLTEWYSMYGSLKSCYTKNGIIVKFSSTVPGQKECIREYEQWLAIPKYMRKHFAKIYAFKRNVLIQEEIRECYDAYDCRHEEKIRKNHWPKLVDTKHNHGHKDGLVKFFDWVYYRTPIYINTKRRLPGSKRRML